MTQARISILSCLLNGIGGAFLGYFLGLFAYAALVEVTWGISDAPGVGFALIAGMLAGGVAGFFAGIAWYLHLLNRPAPSPALRRIVLVLALLSLVVLAFPALFYVYRSWGRAG